MTDNRTRSRTQPSQKPSAPPPRQPSQDAQKMAQKTPPEAGAGNQAPAVYTIPEQARRRGITDDQWFTLRKSLFPGALPESVIMVWDYCKARNLDPMKKPCHIVPMEVTEKYRRDDDSIGERKIWRDVVMPGIYEYRTTAMRTGLYMGHSEPQYGPFVDILGVSQAPEWCSMVFYRWSERANQRVEFPVTVYFEEICATKRGDDGRTANARWKQAPIQMLTKCTEAAGLREAFPDEIGGEHTIEEMEGRVMEDDRVVSTQAPGETKRAATHTDAAAEALRRRAQNAETNRRNDPPADPKPTQPAQRQQPEAQPRAQPATKSAGTSKSEPWDDEPPLDEPGPTVTPLPPIDQKERWISLFVKERDPEQLRQAWEHYVNACEEAGIAELDLDVEAQYQIRAEQLAEK